MTRSLESLDVWVASGNSAKVKELSDFVCSFFPEYDSVKAREPNGVVEDAPTFIGNAKLKAHALVQELIGEGWHNFAVIGDDSGLCVDLLGGKPGIYSARYSGPTANPSKNVDKILFDLEKVSTNISKRTAKYHCSLCMLVVSGGRIKEEYLVEAEREGLIALARQGSGGYAYDSIFLDPKTLFSYGDISYEEKQRDSHRYRAFAKLRSRILESVPL